MAIKLEKGQRINLEKNNGSKLTNICVGVNWGAIEKKGWFGTKTTEAVDLDASCAEFDAANNIVDKIWFVIFIQMIRLLTIAVMI
ncbi:TerD family protein [Bacteroides stercoris]|nr:TerD family protein [Bacteroides stercoris]